VLEICTAISVCLFSILFNFFCTETIAAAAALGFVLPLFLCLPNVWPGLRKSLHVIFLQAICVNICRVSYFLIHYVTLLLVLY